MAGSTYGNIFKITTWGESHGPALGVVIDGCPAGLPLNKEDIQKYLDRRKPGQNSTTTARKESDLVEILSGVFEGTTTGAPISLMVRNGDQHSKDYSNIASVYRPGHADYTFDAKYGIRDYRGGGRSSGRETLSRVAAGAIAIKILESLGIKIEAKATSIGPVVLENGMNDEAVKYIEECKLRQDSIGGCVECKITGMPVGIGDPVFEKLDANLAKAMMSIGAVKAVEIGDGINVSTAVASDNNDNFCIKDGIVCKETNHSGGILGGMSDGDTIVIKAHIKPTPSISRPQSTVTKDGIDTTIEIHGRHDPCIVPRAIVVVETMAALTILDAILLNMTSKLDNIKKFYE